ncbi:hypothetical protein EVAR_34586_1 [Eumeta japonica]|uniref:Uncharacterized protein n=1 Tax=Eumeta variegata TaxID=151549 RepID=A0A4C1VGG4_EUMVA|nr:hypothetical protein EVAR_34586_1 [Eumeta japonica]
MSRAVGTAACRPSAFGEAIMEVQLYGMCRPVIPSSGRLFSRFQPHTIRVHGTQARSAEVSLEPVLR